MSVLELQAGDVFEGYTVRRALGRGGMGAVYLVHHPRFDAEMALKIITIEAATAEELETHRARFTREARTLVRLRHQSIIRVHDFAEHIDDDGVCPYILMEFFPGLDGLKWVKTNPSLERVRHVAIQLADALACAHDAGILHRDLKHGNVLVNGKDEAVLIDFGIAKSESDETVTQTGLSVGTLSHMAPEYLYASKTGGNPEHTIQTDLWAFGCFLYFLTTHRSAFQSGGKGAAALIRIIEEEPHPPVVLARSDVSDDWAKVIDDLLKKKPGERIQSAHELKARLLAVTQPTDPSRATFVPPTVAPVQRGSVVTQAAAIAQAATVQGRAKQNPEQPLAVSISSLSLVMSPARSPGLSPVVSPIPSPGLAPEDDPFHAAAASPQQPSSPAVELPPLDGISGIQMSPPIKPSAAMSLPVSLPEAASGAATPAAPLLAPDASQNAKAEPTKGEPKAAPQQAPAMNLSIIAALPASHDEGLGTFVAALRPEAFAAGAPRQAGEPQVTPDDKTPKTGALNLSAETEPAARDGQPATTLTADVSVVQPLPSFAPPTPKSASKQSAMRSLLLPVGAVAAIAVLGLFSLSLFNKAPNAAQLAAPKAAVEQDEALKRAEERSNKELAALASAQRAEAPVVPNVANVPAPADPAPTTQNVNVAAQPNASDDRPKQPVVRTGPPTSAPVAQEPVDPIAARFGNRNLNTGAFGSAPAASTATATAAAPSATAGIKIPVRVDGEIASTQSPVIAVVTKESRVGGVVLPVGTQIHGVSGQGQGTRVAVNFRFAIVDGKNVPLPGLALAPDGRAGIPGTRTMGNGTDVAARALGSAAGATAEAAAVIAGENPLGAAIRGGGGTAASKTDRLNSDESVIIVKRGARFVVYVGG